MDSPLEVDSPSAVRHGPEAWFGTALALPHGRGAVAQ